MNSDDSIAKSNSEDIENNICTNVKTNDVSVQWGDINEGRIRKKVADKNEWKRVKNQKLRMKGQAHLAFSRDKYKTFKHNTIRPARRLGNRC